MSDPKPGNYELVVDTDEEGVISLSLRHKGRTFFTIGDLVSNGKCSKFTSSSRCPKCFAQFDWMMDGSGKHDTSKCRECGWAR